jgi:hypothetical protein
MNKPLRVIIGLAAILIFTWFNVATYWWVNDFDSIGSAVRSTWRLMTGNWMWLIIISDSLIFLTLIFVWLLRDAAHRGWTGFRRWLWIPAILLLGSPALLAYVLLRPIRPSA